MRVSQRNFYNFLLINLSSISLLLVQSCTTEELGKTLANNFDSIEEFKVEDKSKTIELASEIKNISLEADKGSFKSKSNNKVKIKKKKEKEKRNISSESSKNRRIKQKKSSFKPQPYRIIIKLSEANPSAPAETVTNALRDAGVKFEIEKIERFNTQLNQNSLQPKR